MFSRREKKTLLGSNKLGVAAPAAPPSHAVDHDVAAVDDVFSDSYGLWCDESFSNLSSFAVHMSIKNMNGEITQITEALIAPLAKDALEKEKAIKYHEWLLQQEAQPRLTRTPIFRDRDDAERRLRADYFDDH
nr:hypothetical protein [Tanacetum cinerariifolium]